MKFKLIILAAMIGCLSLTARAEISPQFGSAVGWINFTNPATATAGGFSQPIPDLIAITTDNLTFEMLPNTLLYDTALLSGDTNEVNIWTDSPDGGVTPGNNGGSEVDALAFREGAPLGGTTNLLVNFTVDANTLDTNYEARAFVKILEPFGSWNTVAYTNVVVGAPGSYALNKEVLPGDTGLWFQAGIQLIGLNANATNTSPTYASHGSATVTIDDIIFQDDDIWAPDPDPMTFDSAPAAVSGASITMTATTALDTNFFDSVDHGVEYLFSNVTAGHDSGWQSSSTWLDTGSSTPSVTNDTDIITNPTFSPVNTDWFGFDSGVGAVNPTNFVTSAAGVATITPADSPGGNVEVNYYVQENAIEGATTFSLDASSITADGSPTIFVKEFDSGWNWIGFAGSSALAAGPNSLAFVATAGNIYQAGVLTTSNSVGSYAISNPMLITPVVTPGSTTPLTPLTSYDYQVKARDLSSQKNETGSSAIASETTLAGELNPPTPNPMTFADAGDASPVSILLNATTATDGETSVQYLFSNTVSTATSGWQVETNWLDTGLAPETTNSYTVTARDLNLNTTTSSVPLVVVTAATPASGSFSNSLLTATGDTTDPIVQHNLAKSGLERGTTNVNVAVITFSTTNGATFSPGLGFAGRDVLRTVAAGYENVSFTAYATLTFAGETDLAGYIGMGQGLITGESGSNWGVPELALEGVNGVVAEFKDTTAGGDPNCKIMKTISGEPGPSTGGESLLTAPIGSTETIRARLIHDAVSNTVNITIDKSYVHGDAFVADQDLGTVSTIVDLGGTNVAYSMWTSAPVRVYFGGGEGTSVRDISVVETVVGPPTGVTDLSILSVGGGVAILEWTSITGQKYHVEYKNALTDGSWTADAANQNISGTGGVLATPSAVAGDDVFYQVTTEFE